MVHVTHGVEHIGLTVRNVQEGAAFFTDVLGFRRIGEKPDYPAVFVTDNYTKVTLWQTDDPRQAQSFDRKNHIGLHHLAFKLESDADLDALYEKLKTTPNISIDFAPEPVGNGPSRHFMIYEPSGIRIEFIVRKITMNNETTAPEHNITCGDTDHSAYGANDYNWQELFTDPVASKIPIIPPFTEATARAKVQRAEDLWNTRDPQKVALAYTEDSIWRNRDQFIKGRNDIVAFLTGKWEKELDYKLKKELFLFSDDKIAVQFEYTWHDAKGKYYRSYGIEHWEFAADGRMRKRTASINDVRVDGRII